MSTKYKTTLLAVVLAACMMIGLGRPAHAQLNAVGDVNPTTGFSFWFQDGNLLSVGLCDVFDPALPPVEQAPCLAELIDPNLGFVDGNIGEALFFAVDGGITADTGEFIRAQCVLEAAGPELAGGPNTVGNVALLRVNNVRAGDYSVTTPCGQFNFNVPGDVVEGGRFDGAFAVEGLPTDIPPFSGALGVGAIAPLPPVQSFASNGTGAPGFLGNGGGALEGDVGPLSNPLNPAFPATVTASLDGIVFATITDFVVVGKIFALAPVVLANGQVTFNRDADGNGTVDFLVPQVSGAVTAQAMGVESPLPGEPIVLTLANGFFTASVPITAADVLPNTVAITFNLGVPGDTSVAPQTPQTFPLTVIPVGAAAQVTFTKAPRGGGGTVDFLIPQSPGAVTAQAMGVESPLPGQPVVLTAANAEFTGSVEIPANTPVPANVEVTFNLGVEGELTEIFPVVTLSGSKLLLMLPKIIQEQEQ